MTEYKSFRIISGKPKLVIVNENGKVINYDPKNDELKNIGKENFKHSRIKKYTDEELLNYLKDFYQENKRIPVRRDFENNPGYPGFATYQMHFGSWKKAIILSGMDISKRLIRRDKIYANEELLNYLKDFYQENKRIPITSDFMNNPRYPCMRTYQERFGSWNNALKLVRMDLDSTIKQGMLETTNHKGRLFEIIVMKTFKTKHIDLSGENRNNLIDGICPNGQLYDAKGAKLRKHGWYFGTKNKDKGDDKEAIQWYYFGAFDKDYKELLYVWRVPGEMIDSSQFHVGLYKGKFNIGNMIEYEITEEFKKVIDI